MTLRELLVQRRSELCERWVDAILADYGGDTAEMWRRERDPFANPIGHTLRAGASKLVEALHGDGEPPAAAVEALEAIIKIRSIQDFAPSRAIAFVHMLRDVIRDELAPEVEGGVDSAEIAALERRIERLSLLAFDIYVRCRDRVHRLRQEELKRSVATLLRRWHREDELPAPDSGVVQLAPPPSQAVRR
jgi:hypothetical protein